MFCYLVKICFWRYKIQFISGIYTVLPSTGLLFKKNTIYAKLIFVLSIVSKGYCYQLQRLFPATGAFIKYHFKLLQ